MICTVLLLSDGKNLAHGTHSFILCWNHLLDFAEIMPVDNLALGILRNRKTDAETCLYH